MTQEELDHSLMASYTIESMMGQNPEMPLGVNYSDDINIRMMQEQAPMWSLRIKGFLLSHIAEPNSMQGQFVIAMRGLMNKDYRGNRAMSYLYNSDDTSILVQQIGMLSMHAQFKRVEDIYNIDTDIQRQSIDPESVSVAIGLYTYFTVLNNRNLSAEDFNDLFIRSFCDYYNNWMTRQLMFRMNGNRWKSSFSGVLLDD